MDCNEEDLQALYTWVRLGMAWCGMVLTIPHEQEVPLPSSVTL